MSRLSVTNQGVITNIAGLSIPHGCSTCQIVYQDLSDQESGRSMTGVMWKGVMGEIRTLKTTWNAEYPGLIRQILQAVRMSNGFNVTFYDVETGTYDTSEFYVGDRTTDFKCFYDGHELIGLSMNLIEVSPYT